MSHLVKLINSCLRVGEWPLQLTAGHQLFLQLDHLLDLLIKITSQMIAKHCLTGQANIQWLTIDDSKHKSWY